MYKHNNFHGETFNTLNLYPLSEDLKEIVKLEDKKVETNLN